jgi:hypothetical protein
MGLGSMFKAVVNGSSVTVVPNIQPISPIADLVVNKTWLDCFYDNVKTHAGLVLTCKDLIDNEEIVVPRAYALEYLYVFTEYDKPFVNPASDEIYELRWRPPTLHEEQQAVSFDKDELRELEITMSERQPQGFSGFSGYPASMGASGISGFSNFSLSGVMGSFSTPFASINANGDMYFNGTFNGTINLPFTGTGVTP